MHRNTKLKIPEGASVLEIGGGGFPHPQTSLILDKYLDDYGLRQRGGSCLVMDRPFVNADACKMPFNDKSFDYVIASHVIEHIPETHIFEFASELNRVAKAGYIEAPGPLYETLRDINEHIWFVVCFENVVHLCQKHKSDIPPQKKLIEPMFCDPVFGSIISRHSDIWHTGLKWEGSFEIKIHVSLEELWKFYNEEDLLLRVKNQVKSDRMVQEKKSRILDPSFVKKIKSTFSFRILKTLKQTCVKFLYIDNDTQVHKSYLPWREVVVCPNCMGCLQEKEGILECKTCNVNYRILEGDIPSFLNSIEEKP